MAAWIVAAGAVVGVRLAAVIEAWPTYAANPLSVLAITEGASPPMAASWAGWRHCGCGQAGSTCPQVGCSTVAGPPAGNRPRRRHHHGEHRAAPAELPWSVVYPN